MIDQPLLDLLKIDPETPLELTTDGRPLLVSPVTDPDQAKFAAALEEPIGAMGRRCNGWLIDPWRPIF